MAHMGMEALGWAGSAGFLPSLVQGFGFGAY